MSPGSAAVGSEVAVSSFLRQPNTHWTGLVPSIKNVAARCSDELLLCCWSGPLFPSTRRLRCKLMHCAWRWDLSFVVTLHRGRTEAGSEPWSYTPAFKTPVQFCLIATSSRRVTL